MFRIVVVTGNKRLEPARQDVNWVVVTPIVVIRKYDMEAPIQLGSGEIVEMLRDNGEAYQVV